jgi:hypothetical protein
MVAVEVTNSQLCKSIHSKIVYGSAMSSLNGRDDGEGPLRLVGTVDTTVRDQSDFLEQNSTLGTVMMLVCIRSPRAHLRSVSQI